MERLTAGRLKVIRATLAVGQGNRCALCQGAFGASPPFDPVLDHNHKTGAVRGVLHRGCNSLLGHIENNSPRYGVNQNLFAFAHGVAPYLQKHMVNVTGFLHPTYKTEDEKRLLRNKRARLSRAKKKENK